MRLFVALDLDPDIRRRIAEFREQMRAYAPDVRWVGPETFHITLQFLGETEKLDAIRAALQPLRGAPIALSFRGTGFFPNPKSPRVFWIGIEADEHLQTLANSLGEALRPPGFKRDAGPFKPHLTLARASEAGTRRARVDGAASAGD
jgi:RNA 2',3'-cyclic 3'-phosphodiesterase